MHAHGITDFRAQRLAGVSPRSFVWGGRIHGHPNPPTLKIDFLLEFRPLYFENGGKCKIFICVKKKDTEISSFLGARPPLIFQLRGRVPPSLRFRRP